MRSSGPIPPEHEDIARGSGAAAILMFLQIASVGYLGFTCFYLLKHGPQVFWTLTTLSASYHYYLPAGFALFTRLPSDPLTDKVSLVSLVTGCITWAIYGICLEPMLSGRGITGAAPLWQTVLAGLGGLAAAALIRMAFQRWTAPARENYKKYQGKSKIPNKGIGNVIIDPAAANGAERQSEKK